MAKVSSRFSVKPGIFYAVAAAIFILQAGLLLRSALKTGVTFDEPHYIALSAFSAVNGRVPVASVGHPPLWTWVRGVFMRPAGILLPSPEDSAKFDRGFKYAYQYGNHIIHHQRISEVRLVFLARVSGILLALAAGLALLGFVRRVYGGAPALLVFAIYALDPNILAHAPLATYDMPVSCLAMIGLCMAAWPGAGAATAFFAGVVAAAMVLTKQTGALVLPFIVMAAALKDRRKYILFWLGGAVAALLLCMLVQPLSGIVMEYADKYREAAPFRFSMAADWLKMAAAKAPPAAFVAVGVLAAGFGLWRKNTRAAIFAGASVFYFVCAISAAGHGPQAKFLLPSLCLAYPVLACAAASSRRAMVALFVMAALQAGSCALAYPRWLTYFNITCPDGSLKFPESNGDWGQSLGALGKIKDGMPDCGWIVAYHGTDDPDVHIGRFRNIYSAPMLKVTATPLSRNQKNEMLAVSRSYSMGRHMPPGAQWEWLAAERRLMTVEDTIDVYDITGSTSARRNILEIERLIKAAK